jgi:hypothetical protein
MYESHIQFVMKRFEKNFCRAKWVKKPSAKGTVWQDLIGVNNGTK